MLNLLRDRCFPVRRQDGTVDTIALFQLGESENPVVDFIAPRPDLRGAMLEFAIGLLQTTLTPKQDLAWREAYKHPPSSTDLKDAFAPLEPFFELWGDGPRFMQDHTLKPTDGNIKTIDGLLIDAPGGNTLKLNIDHFIKRDQVQQVSPFWTAMALFCLQIMAPSGGKGHRTGLRGGGPLTTIFQRRTLWQTLWCAVLNRNDFFGDDAERWQDASPEAFLPWTQPTHTSEKGAEVSNTDHHPAMVYWAMPRRIRLGEPQTGSFTCDLSGDATDTVYCDFVTKAYGNNYAESWQHPLSPHYLDKDGIPRPVHGQPGGIGYQHWTGLLFMSQDTKNQRLPAEAIRAFTLQRRGFIDDSKRPRLLAFGYDMDNAKARAWIEAEMPVQLPADDDETTMKDYAVAVEQCIDAARSALGQLRQAFKKATHREGISPRGDLDFLNTAFWASTEKGFLPATASLAKDPAAETPRIDWLRFLHDRVLQLFDHHTDSRDIAVVDPKRVVDARAELAKFTNPNGKKVRSFVGLSPLKKKSA